MIDPFARHHAAERAQAKRKAQELAEGQTATQRAARINSAKKAREAATRPEPPYPWPEKFYKLNQD